MKRRTLLIICVSVLLALLPGCDLWLEEPPKIEYGWTTRPDGVISIQTTVTIGTGTSSYDCSGLSGGDIIKVSSGSRGELTISDCAGSDGNPIWIINDGGQVDISSGTHSYGLTIDDCEYFTLTGRGHQEFYGFKITNYENAGLYIHNCSDEYIVERVEVGEEASGDTGNAGVRMNCLSAYSATATIENVTFRDMYIHGPESSCFYFNHNTTQSNPGRPFDGAYLYRNRLEGCGTEGFQMRNGDNCEIHHNWIEDTGFNLASKPGNSGAGIVLGIEIGTCEVWRNVITDTLVGINGLQRDEAVHIHNNLIVGQNDIGAVAGRGIWIQTNGQGITITHNTVLDTEDDGIFSKSGDTDGTITNNIVAGIGGDYIDSDYTTVSNNITGTIAAQDFRSGDGLFHLTSSSDAVGAADDGSDCGWLDYN